MKSALLNFGNLNIPKAETYGGILINAKGEVLLRKPSGHFGGYAWTFAKGRPQASELPHQTALREVRTETGYEANIIAAIPQLFSSTTSNTAFFLMEPAGKQRRFNRETSTTIWANLDEAERLISETTNINGRQRDLDIVRHVRRTITELPHERRPAVRKEDWKIRALPKLYTEITLGFEYDDEMIARIRKGFLPQSMDDKWFIWFGEGGLNIHRSWTGFCVYRIKFERDASRWRASTVRVNRKPEEYACTDDEEDREIIRRLIEELLIQRSADPASPPSRNAREVPVRNVPRQSAGGVLGEPEAIKCILTHFSSEVIRKFSLMDSDEYMAWVKSECGRLNQLLLGYTPDEKRTDWKRGPWNTPEQMGQFIRISMQMDGDNRHSVRDALMQLAYDLVSTTLENKGKDPEQWGWQLEAAMEQVSNAVLGLPPGD